MKKQAFIALLFFLATALFFFYPLLRGYAPFPGDLLVGEYAPYNSYPFKGYAPGGFPNKGQNFDIIKLLYPAKEFSIRMLKMGQFPLWNPHNFSGNPHLASLQSGTFYPFNVFFFIFPFAFAWSLYIFAQPVLAGLFTFLFLRELKLSFKSSLFGGIAYSFSSYFIVWMQYGNIGHTILWLPLEMLLFLRIMKKPSIGLVTYLVFVIAFGIFAGYIQIVFYKYIFLFFFSLFSFFKFKNRVPFRTYIILLFGIFFLPPLLASAALFPAVELFSQSSRAAYEYHQLIKLLIPLYHIVSFFVPDFFGNPATRNYWLSGTYIERVTYIGIVPLFFIIYGLVYKRTYWVRFFAATLIIVLLLTFDSFFSKIIYSFQIPFVSTGVPSRMMFIFCFAASVLSALGFHSFETEKSKNAFIKTAIVLGGVFTSLWIFVFVSPHVFGNASWVSHLAISKRNLVIPSFILFGLLAFFVFSTLNNFARKRMLTVIFILTIFDLFYFFHKITPFAPWQSVFPQKEVLTKLKSIQGIYRSWGYGSANIETNIQTHEGMYSTDGYDALHIKRYGELLSASKDGKVQSQIPRSEADIPNGFGSEDLKSNPYRQRVLNLLGIKYVLNKIPPEPSNNTPDYLTFSQDSYQMIWQEGPFQIYENKRVLPRIFLAPNYIVESDKDKIIERIFDGKIDFRKTLILENEPGSKYKFENDPNATVVLNNYSPNRIDLTTNASKDMLLFLSDNYFPGWQVTIDGENDVIYRANYSFRAVAIPQGSHGIVFRYHPQSFDIGFKISIFTFLFLVVLYLVSRYKNPILNK